MNKKLSKKIYILLILYLIIFNLIFNVSNVYAADVLNGDAVTVETNEENNDTMSLPTPTITNTEETIEVPNSEGLCEDCGEKTIKRKCKKDGTYVCDDCWIDNHADCEEDTEDAYVNQQQQYTQQILDNRKQKEIEENNEGDIIAIIKTSVAKWYYILRLIVIAFMLVLLIFIGIKMSISTIASEKAVYKRMLIDWVTGMIIVFSIHYIMIFILNVNDSVVNILKEMSKKSAESIQQEYEYGEQGEKTTEELETTMYDSARTRAYSIKVTDGFFGLVMYGFLVFYAWKFALIYLKRLMNVIILTLVSPIVAGSYAVNKVITGKSKIFSTWLSEYILNVIIQIVHGFIYVSFVSIAFQIALQSLPGIIFAFVIISFMSKCEHILREIFRMSGGDGSLFGDMADRTNFKSMKEHATASGALLGVNANKKIMGAMYGGAAKIAGSAASFAVGKAMQARANSKSYQDKQLAEEQAKKDAWNELNQPLDELVSEGAQIDRDMDEISKRTEDAKQQVEALEKEKQELQSQKEKLDKEWKEQWALGENGLADDLVEQEQQLNQKMQENEEQLEMVRQQLENNQRDEKVQQNKRKAWEQRRDEAIDERNTRFMNQIGKEGLKANIKGVFNPKHYVSFDAKTGKMKANNVKAELKKQLGLQNLLGISDDEKKVLKNQTKFWKKTVTGVMAGIAGTATLMVHPAIGFGLICKYANARKDIHKRRKIYNKYKTIENGQYKFKGYSDATRKTLSYGASLNMREFEQLEFLHSKKEKQAYKQAYVDFCNYSADRQIDKYRDAYNSYNENIQKEIEQKSTADLMMDADIRDYEDRMITVKDTVIKIEKNDNIEEFIEEIREVDDKKELTKYEKVMALQDVIEHHKQELITDSLEKFCITKKVVDIDKLGDLSPSENIAIKLQILNKLETAGVIKKGEMEIKDLNISNGDIQTMQDKLTDNKDETNERLQERVVQDSILEYIKETGNTNINEDNAKEEIQKMAIEKMISEDEKQTKNVLEELNLQKEQTLEEEATITTNITELLEKVKEMFDKTQNKVKKISKDDFQLDIDETEREILESRAVTSETNEMKNKLEEALYTEQDDSLDDSQLEMLFMLSNIAKQNEEVRITDKKKENKKAISVPEIEGKLEYFLDIIENEKRAQVDLGIGNNREEKVFNRAQSVKTEVYGPVTDIMSLINDDGINKY